MARQSIIPFTSSLYFDGVNDYISGLTNTARTAGQPIAWFARIKALNTGTCIVGSRNGSGAGQLSKIGISATGLLSFDHDTTGAGGTVSGVSDIRNRWVSVVGVYNGATLRVYVNGTLENTLARANCVLSSTTMAIGRRADTSAEYFKGYMNSVATSYDTITDSDVLYWHTTNILPAGKTLHKEYQLSEGSGTTATDTSGNGNNGTINNGAIWYTTDMYSRARTAASNRRVIQDMKASLKFEGDALDRRIQISTPPAVGTSSDYTTGAWVRLYPKSSSHSINNANFDFASNRGYLFQVNKSNGAVFCYFGNASVSSTAGIFKYGEWNFIVYEMTGTTLNVYINDMTTPAATLSVTRKADHTTPIGYFGQEYNGAGTGNRMLGNISTAFATNNVLTANQKTDIMNGKSVPTLTGPLYLCNEGAGSTAYDLSGNANNGTITGASFTSDVPSRKRRVVGGNLVRNGDFEYAPPFTAATNTVAWIDGTASGSASNMLFGWKLSGFGVSGSARFDPANAHSGNYAMKVSTLSANNNIDVSLRQTLADLLANGIPVLPNTSYTFSAYAKSVLNSGAATTGARIQVVQKDASNNTVGSTVTYPIGAATTPWTQYTSSFTTAATCRYIIIFLTVNGNDGAATAIMDAWFDDITLVKN